MKTSTQHVIAAGLFVCGLGLARVAPAQVQAPHVGLFFDTAGIACSATLEPFDPFGVEVYLLAFVDPGTELAGALLRVELPPLLHLDNPRWPKNTDRAGDLTSTTGLDLQFQVCPVATSEPLLLATFTLNDYSLGDVRPDLQIEILGGTITAPDTLVLNEPNLKVCDPNQPHGYSGLIAAPSTRATLNCSTGECPCEQTAVVPVTWTAVRKLYADD